MDGFLSLCASCSRCHSLTDPNKAGIPAKVPELFRVPVCVDVGALCGFRTARAAPAPVSRNFHAALVPVW
jgi:hypothetical protein